MGGLLSSNKGAGRNTSLPGTGNDPLPFTTENSSGSGDGSLTVSNLDTSPSTQSPNHFSSTEMDNLNDLIRQSATLNNNSSFNSNLTHIVSPGDNGSDDDFRFNIFGTVIYPFRWLTLPTLYSWLGPLSSLAMIIGCVLPYVPQYSTIFKAQNCTGFSTFVCLTLLVANILRVAFWFGHPFELPLLIQSVIMIFTQILLLELCIRVKRKNSGTYSRKKTLFDCNPKYFWRWTDLMSYIEFLIFATVLLGVAMYFLVDCEPFVEAIGYCALVTESMLGLPQVIKNYTNKSVEGMSLSMVLMWLAGDTFKTGYFIANDVPFQFWLCGLLQITIDLLILFQVCLFRQNAPIKKSSRADYSLEEMAQR